jgi:hypothetical protein
MNPDSQLANPEIAARTASPLTSHVDAFVRGIAYRLQYYYGSPSAQLLLSIYRPYIHAMAETLAYEDVMMFIEREVNELFHFPEQWFFCLADIDITCQADLLEGVVVSQYYCIRKGGVDFHHTTLKEAVVYVATEHAGVKKTPAVVTDMKSRVTKSSLLKPSVLRKLTYHLYDLFLLYWRAKRVPSSRTR